VEKTKNRQSCDTVPLIVKETSLARTVVEILFFLSRRLFW
jgi:hypothetical protein